jgi:ribonuclease HI
LVKRRAGGPETGSSSLILTKIMKKQSYNFESLKSATEFIYYCAKLAELAQLDLQTSLNDNTVELIFTDTVTKSALNQIQQKYSSMQPQKVPKLTPGSGAGAVVHGKLIIHADGGSRGNPGPSASGFVISDGEKTLFEGGEYLGITTNNQAEYQAVKISMVKALSIGAKQLEYFLDSLLVVNQMNGKFKVKNKDLWPIYNDIKELMLQFPGGVVFNHVLREYNKEADAEVNKILDSLSK